MASETDDLTMTVRRSGGGLEVELRNGGGRLIGQLPNDMEGGFAEILGDRQEFSGPLWDWSERQVAWLIDQLADRQYLAIR